MTMILSDKTTWFFHLSLEKREIDLSSTSVSGERRGQRERRKIVTESPKREKERKEENGDCQASTIEIKQWRSTSSVCQSSFSSQGKFLQTLSINHRYFWTQTSVISYTQTKHINGKDQGHEHVLSTSFFLLTWEDLPLCCTRWARKGTDAQIRQWTRLSILSVSRANHRWHQTTSSMLSFARSLFV